MVAGVLSVPEKSGVWKLQCRHRVCLSGRRPEPSSLCWKKREHFDGTLSRLCARTIRENGVPACHCLAGHVDHKTCCSPSDLSVREWDIPELQATCPVRTEGSLLRKPSRGSAARARTQATVCLHLHTLKSLEGTGLHQVTAWLSAVQTPPLLRGSRLRGEH